MDDAGDRILLQDINGIFRGPAAVDINRQVQFCGHLQLGPEEALLIFPGVRVGIVIQPGFANHVGMAFQHSLFQGGEPGIVMIILKILRMDTDGQPEIRIPFPQLPAAGEIMITAADDDGLVYIRRQHPSDHRIPVLIKLT